MGRHRLGSGTEPGGVHDLTLTLHGDFQFASVRFGAVIAYGLVVAAGQLDRRSVTPREVY
ncbi:hypothetical protein ABTY98_01185 [Streptomyces sp. NPDC096040]|uniref:hypothetical protein n=1 Tax=Streptomyces sp. NPDC096040 TaxID=3155541 RepID=UPI00332E3341